MLLDHSEYLLYQIDREIAAIAPELGRRALLGDVRDRRRLDKVFAEEKPELVFHAAALKHVSLAETNPLEAMRTRFTQPPGGGGLSGGQCFADAADLHRQGRLTHQRDGRQQTCRRADLPGAGSRQRFGRQGLPFRGGALRQCAGLTGSVVPLFQQQLAAGGPLTVTDRDMTRYFMTTREAVELVLQAAALARRQPRPGGVLMLDMGEPVRIVDLARQMIRLAGKRPDIDIKIVFTTAGAPAKTIHESLHRADEKAAAAGVPGLLAVEAGAPDWTMLRGSLARLAAASQAGDLASASAALADLVPDYTREEAAA